MFTGVSDGLFLVVFTPFPHCLPEGKPGVACENPHCTAAPLLRPTLHIEDRDPIPEEQVRGKERHWLPLKKPSIYNLPVAWVTSDKLLKFCF